MEDLLDKYHSLETRKRLLLCFLLAMIYPFMEFLETNDTLEGNLEASITAYEAAKVNLQKEKKKVKALPDLEAMSGEVMAKISTARKYLPKDISFDLILNKFGTFERDLGIQIIKFEPGLSVAGDLGFARVPLTLELRGLFGNVMLFLDRVTHMHNLVHIEGLDFRPNHSDREDGKIKTDLKASLVFYQGVGI